MWGMGLRCIGVLFLTCTLFAAQQASQVQQRLAGLSPYFSLVAAYNSFGESILFQVNFVWPISGASNDSCSDHSVFINNIFSILEYESPERFLASKMPARMGLNTTLSLNLTAEKWRELANQVSNMLNFLNNLAASFNYPEKQYDISFLNMCIGKFQERAQQLERARSDPQYSVYQYAMQSEAEALIPELLRRLERLSNAIYATLPPRTFSIPFAVFRADNLSVRVVGNGLNAKVSYSLNNTESTRGSTGVQPLGKGELVFRRSIGSCGTIEYLNGETVSGILWVAEGKLGFGGQVVPQNSSLFFVIDPYANVLPVYARVNNQLVLRLTQPTQENPYGHIYPITVTRNRNLNWSWNNMRGIFLNTYHTEEPTTSALARPSDRAQRRNRDYPYRFDEREVAWYESVEASAPWAIPLLDRDRDTCLSYAEYMTWRSQVRSKNAAATQWAMENLWSWQLRELPRDATHGFVVFDRLSDDQKEQVNAYIASHPFLNPNQLGDDPTPWRDVYELIDLYWKGRYNPQTGQISDAAPRHTTTTSQDATSAQQNIWSFIQDNLSGQQSGQGSGQGSGR